MIWIFLIPINFADHPEKTDANIDIFKNSIDKALVYYLEIPEYLRGDAVADFILVDNDSVQFLPNFGMAIVVPMPGKIQATGKSNATGKKMCVAGDEKKVQVSGCAYTAGQYSVPGVGTLKIQALAADQQARHTNSGGKAVLLKGKQFEAVFEVQTPAQMPPPASTPDSTPLYSGKGMFITTNLTVKGT